jgi:hypothetical protein
MRLETTSSSKSSSFLDEDDDIQLLFNYSDTTTIKSSALAQQLMFPSKGEGFFWFVMFIVILSSIAFIVSISIMNNSSFSSSDTASARDAMATSLVVGLYGLIAAFLAGSFHFTGRTKAKNLWDSLYYCFRDDVVYLTHENKQCASPRMMRTEILKY